MMSHISFGAVQQPFEFQTIGVTVGDDVAHLTDNCGENEHADQIADNCEYVPFGVQEWVKIYHCRFLLAQEGKRCANFT
jgi:hypothetical protein